MRGYDAWLTHDPRDDAQAAFEWFCEHADLDPDDPETESAFETWTADQHEAAAEREAEARADAREEDYGWDHD